MKYSCSGGFQAESETANSMFGKGCLHGLRTGHRLFQPPSRFARMLTGMWQLLPTTPCAPAASFLSSEVKEILQSGEEAAITGDEKNIFPAGSRGKDRKDQIKGLCWLGRLLRAAERGRWFSVPAVPSPGRARSGTAGGCSALPERPRGLCRVGTRSGRALLSLACFPQPARGWAERRRKR